MSRPPTEPPSLPRRLLEAILPADFRADSILGDLHEEYVLRRARPRNWARTCYWMDALGVSLRYLVENQRRRRTSRGRQRRYQSTMDHLVLNVRYAVRRLLRAPAFSLIAILSLGLGIGANTAMFSLVNAVILRDLPFDDLETLVDVYESFDGFSHGTLSYTRTTRT